MRRMKNFARRVRARKQDLGIMNLAERLSSEIAEILGHASPG